MVMQAGRESIRRGMVILAATKTTCGLLWGLRYIGPHHLNKEEIFRFKSTDPLVLSVPTESNLVTRLLLWIEWPLSFCKELFLIHRNSPMGTRRPSGQTWQFMIATWLLRGSITEPV